MYAGPSYTDTAALYTNKSGLTDTAPLYTYSDLFILLQAHSALM